jgi:hypothetical protein
MWRFTSISTAPLLRMIRPDALFDRYADPAWRVIEEQWQTGRRSSRECMRAGRPFRHLSQLDQFADGIEIDSSSPKFLRLCRRLIGSSIAHWRWPGSNYLFSPISSFPWVATAGSDCFPYTRDDCPSRMGVCKWPRHYNARSAACHDRRWTIRFLHHREGKLRIG